MASSCQPDLPQTDSIELKNTNGLSVSVGGWYLTDDFYTPKKYRIATNTVLAAGGYVVFDEGDFNTPTNLPTSFSMSSVGDEVWLFSADGSSNLTGYYHGYSFGAQQNGVCFGRYVNSEGKEHFVAEGTNTLGWANAYPRVGPVVVSEIMYHPADVGTNDNARDEYIELANVTGVAAPLYDVLNPTNTWRLRDAVDYDFPTNVSVAAGGRLVVVGFDPVADTNALAGFRAAYGTNVAVYGPWSGKLDNSGEQIELKRPDNPNVDEVPYILVEGIDYRDEGPWDAGADGTGKSLQRIVLGNFGDEPLNWYAGLPTPAGLAPLGTDSDGDGMSDWAEWQAGTDRTNGTSLIQFTAQPAGLGQVVVRWQGVTGKWYAVDRTTNLLAGGIFTTLQAGIAGQMPETTYTDTNTVGDLNLYRIRLDLR